MINPVVYPVPQTDHRVINTVLQDAMFRRRNPAITGTGSWGERLQIRDLIFEI